ncbi:MAG: hypothetical protein KGH61_02620 [Candidatus Micrarchaeota archaeon]|nr:hypothetical protein [Candidatus Micrarchaeota archaeon]MDE1847819.1 hypothetical protein [Candidatus Micrarchaeota archaeon]MDE1864375.1 hypothetical protein [Candidatus Micrarchaeota archaeon]
MENLPEESLKKYNQLYLAIILRYKDYIEEKEKLNVAELPKLITPQDESVAAISNRIKSAFQNYSYPRDFEAAARFAFEYVKNEISNVSLPIEFWLMPSETIKSEAGDVFDRATLLCSIFLALGNVSSKVVIVTGSTARKFIVYAELGQKIISHDLEDGPRQFPDKEAFIKSLRLDSDDELTAYEFSDKMYNSLA